MLNAITILFLFLPILCGALRTTYLLPDQTVTYAPSDRVDNEPLHVYCYKGRHPSFLRFFETVELRISIANDDYTQYEGDTAAEVLQHYHDDQSLFSISLFEQKRSRLELSPFKSQCIGIAAHQPYSVHLADVLIDSWRLTQVLLGISLFFFSKKLCENSLFYYIAGITVGIGASFILLLGLMAKLFPRRPMMYGMLIGGWTICVYVLKFLVDNMQVIFVTYRQYVCWYVMLTGLASFLVCYRFGPPTNRRSKNIIKWILQFIALAMIFFSSRFEAATVSIILVLLTIYYFPRSLYHKVNKWYRRAFPKRRRLLTQEQYAIEGIRETNKSLYELRKFVNSPECKAWRVMSALKDPARFADFANGEDHLQAEEIAQYERNQRGNRFDVDRDEDSSDDYDNEHVPEQQLNQRQIVPNQRRLNYINDAHNPNDEYEIDSDGDDDDDDNEYDEYPVLISHRHPSPSDEDYTFNQAINRALNSLR